jgi:protein-S-isoprenylcysteine O-methyltransferase Ste14
VSDAAAILPRRRARIAAALARRRVPLGFVFGAGVLWLARPTMTSLIIGGAIAVAGESFRIWAAGHLEKGREVTRSGPYHLTRHPLYVGSTIIGLGLAVASARLSAASLVAAYLCSTLLSAIRTEEAGMRASFGDQYDAYLESRAKPVDRPFSFGRAMRNREHRAIAGLIIVAAILAAKAALGTG